MKKSMENLKIRPFRKKDAEEVSKLIVRNLKEINSREYSMELIEKSAIDFTPQKIIEKSKKREIIIAKIGEKIVGTASIGLLGEIEDKIRYVFSVNVLPEYQYKGIGRNLMESIEKIATDKGIYKLIVPAGKLSKEFYRKLGYEYKKDTKNGLVEGIVLLEKQI